MTWLSLSWSSRVSTTLIDFVICYHRFLLLPYGFNSAGFTRFEWYLRSPLFFLHFDFLDLLRQRHSFCLFQEHHVAQTYDTKQNEDCHRIDVVSLEIAEVDRAGSWGKSTYSWNYPWSDSSGSWWIEFTEVNLEVAEIEGDRPSKDEDNDDLYDSFNTKALIFRFLHKVKQQSTGGAYTKENHAPGFSWYTLNQKERRNKSTQLRKLNYKIADVDIETNTVNDKSRPVVHRIGHKGHDRSTNCDDSKTGKSAKVKRSYDLPIVILCHLLCHYILNIFFSKYIINSMIYLPYLVHDLHRFLRPFFQQKLRSFIAEEVQEHQVDDAGSCQDYDPYNSPVVHKIEESCDDDGPYWEPNLHKDWVFLSLLLSDDLPEVKKADINTNIRTESA